MNAMEITYAALQKEEVKPMAIALEAVEQTVTTPQQPSRKSRREAIARRALLAIIILMLMSLGLYVLDSIHEIDSEIGKIHAGMVTEGSLWPD